jgi:hypothetical protein
MTGELPAAIDRAFARHDAFERDGDGFVVGTTVFEGRVTAVDGGGRAVYTVTVPVPSIRATTADEVGEAVAEGWLDTLRRRLADAPVATRSDIDLETFDVERDGEDVYVTYGFEWDDPSRAADIAKTLIEYVEGTYVEGVIPGYEYESPVADLLDRASQGEGGGTPL